MRKIFAWLILFSMLACIMPVAISASEIADDPFRGKVFSILGDSISTFAGYIPTADGFNLEHLARYPQDNLLTNVNETWWLQIINRLGGRLGINDSWRGATVSGAVPVTTGTTGENAAMCNLTRIQNLGSNGTPDVIMFYGGTNDLAHVSKVGSFDPDSAPETVDLTTKKWDNLADGYVHTLLRLKHYYPDALILCLLPTYTTSYYSNEKLAQGNGVLTEICQHYGVAYTDLRYCGITTGDLPDNIHPNAAGMDYITEAALEALYTCPVDAGENVVYTVTHNLKNATASLGHYKGISAGIPFEETVSGNELAVTVTMGGVDITDSCYSNGKVCIDSVSGDLVITAISKFTLDGRLQYPEEPYYGINLWPLLKHDTDYYTATGWGEHPSGKVRSVTLPVSEGERLYASSFGPVSENSGDVNGIRVTFFSDDGLLETVSPDKVYQEFCQQGYILVPEAATAVCVPMWTECESWELYIYPYHAYSDQLQAVPEISCRKLNLWSVLEHSTQYYTVSGWGTHTSGQVRSVTFPVTAGDRIYATSFGASGSNGSTVNGIRVTWFGETDVLKSLGPNDVYAEFSECGYLTAPEGAAAINVPMWNDSETNELYILNSRHIYEDGMCISCGISAPVLILDDEETVISGYDMLYEALDDAQSYQTVRLMADITAEHIAVLPNVILDMNGYTLFADSIITYESSCVIDSSENVSGVLQIGEADGNMISCNNPSLPVYDIIYGGYRFFEINVESCAVTGGNKYWFKIKSEKFAQLYTLIGTEADVQIRVKMTWDGQTENVYATADQTFTKLWAERYMDNSDVYITVTVAENEGVENFRLIPVITSGGVEISGAEM